MRNLLLAFMFLFIIEDSFSQEILSNEDDNKIRLVMQMQEDSWNAGDIDKFMEGYWKSEQLVFVSSSGITYGWDATKESYKKRYPDINAMGTLKFNIISISRIDVSTAMILGKFDLNRKTNSLSGYFTLVCKRIDNEWLIISDHTSSDD